MFPLVIFGQKYTISGYIKDKSSGEELLGANVIVNEGKSGTSANSYGFYSISLPAGTYEISFSFVGYAEQKKTINLDSDKTLNIELENSAVVTQEVVVSSERSRNVEDSRMSVTKIPIETVKTLPAFMGEVDVLKTVQLLPGVQAAGDGNSGFYVRGGGPDQNLILLDEAIIYNASHLLGFFSVFNADAIKDMEIYKGGMPAQYGGRISSVLDISMKNGNMKKFEAEGGIGTISSRLTVQGPIVKDKASFLISGRRTYIDLLIKPFTKKESLLRSSGYYFYDVNAKFNYRFSDKDRLYISAYYGEDVFNFKSNDAGFAMGIPWGNGMASIRWNHLFSNKFFSNTTFVASDYKFQTSIEMTSDENSGTDFSFIQDSGIRDFYIKQDFTWLPNPKHNIKFGLEYIYHIFSPNSVSASLADMSFESVTKNKQYAHEAAIYIGDDFKINDRITLYAGVRGSIFNQVGPFTRYIKDEYYLQTIDSVVYKKNESVALYHSIEPRVSIKVGLDKSSSIKASFMQNKQYIHLASLSASTLPTDLWVPCSDRLKPQMGRQYAIGYFRNFFNDHFEASVEVYYKDMYNLIEYADGALPGDEVVQDNADNYFITGDGNSYGIEFFIKKRTGSFTGWIGYTLSKTDRFFDDVNDGKKFPAKYDRRHDISVTATYTITEKLTASAIFIYATGNTTTLPASRYMIDGELTSEYGERNSYRMAPYHRLDLSLTWDHKKTDKWTSSWNFSIYNVYNRKNPYFVYFENSGTVKDGTFKTTAKQVSLFPILPSVTWNFKF
ncbi:MAG: TonB-dependent receptor [Bacteroidales bacterium]|jgi:outer membrane receptor for ferrienterochelin and colicin|nr:TonB-dependent receptor [Bacteroidales bacterium]